MIDINNSQEFDIDTYNEELAEEKTKLQKSRSQGLGGGLYSAPPPTILGGGLGGLLSPRPSTILGDSRNLYGGGLGGALAEYALDESAKDAVKKRATDELTDPINFLKRRYPGKSLFRYVQTHPDLDHMRGLKNLHDNIGFTNFWDTSHTKPTPSYRSDADKTDWEFYQKLRGGNAGTKVLRFTRGDAFYAFAKEEDGRPGGDNIEILSPTAAFIDTCNKAGKSNDLSLVLRVKHASASVLLPGDVETAAWDDMVATYGANLKSSFLKASHHGRDSGYHLKALKLIDPMMTIVSVGNKPDTDASNKYRQVTQKLVPSTRYHGDIEIRIDDAGNYQWFVDRHAGN